MFLVLNEVPSNKVKEKQQDKLMVLNPIAKDDRHQQLRDREMREAHVEKQNYSISKLREMKVYQFTHNLCFLQKCWSEPE